MNQIINSTCVDEFRSVFKTFILSEYECIYVSLGSKYNQQYIEYKVPINETVKKMSNAEWQMIPGFIRGKKTLSICIDRFEGSKDKEKNNKILKKIMDPNITMIICDIYGTVQLFEFIISIILEQLKLYSIPQSTFIIVNYLRFISPNHTENYLEENVSHYIQKKMDKTIYRNCLYEWFGYQPNLYNIIYRYNCRIISYMLSCIVLTLQKNIKNTELSSFNINILFGKSIDTQILATFLKNTYDITIIDEMKSFYELYN